ncbi:U2-type spliceosomal complex subunit CWC24 [Kluyveromyces lactis]|uniref:Pre-mRNA-splicing factor CWC24 n=1 Tax=Kluyveromyces lactis (strain ATCC 8585 / CBS 2359 / DSM 70799 / NBRC 1267 / NRRL Y-1140 / WM37) TaxID=284590 RepID=CWC24_KLULA|nr:uncharacterized protein KLLA0_C18260g [Kluyveromyces lactis]Q6CSS6.1 RecName: Full=Pre-mRNA-splicing factor CWC24 [Kluyveromyces lactis NRRL Y-1140]CAH01864.1 KLLA0C18260p [Kluyveromyces lactis]|eukprot:XP_453013.1 uncharacterized protein KLLA0_C18260g [Kluyveromyces lactis]
MFKKRVVKGSRDSKRKRLADEAVASDPVLPKDTGKTAVAEAQVEVENEDKRALYLAKEREEQEQELELRRKERTVLEQEIDEDIERKAKAKVSGFVKPVSKNMKTVTITDYQPDICKDFQKTGYCGYGDSCKFLHSRDDVAGGWKLNTDWKVDETQEKEVLKELEEIPFRCFLCKKEYTSPVVTKCNHYFCSSCFMKQMKVSTNCPICGKETEGAAKMATKLRKLLKKT